MEESVGLGGGDSDWISGTVLPKKVQLALIKKLALILHAVSFGLFNKRMVI